MICNLLQRLPQRISLCLELMPLPQRFDIDKTANVDSYATLFSNMNARSIIISGWVREWLSPQFTVSVQRRLTFRYLIHLLEHPFLFSFASYLAMSATAAFPMDCADTLAAPYSLSRHFEIVLFRPLETAFQPRYLRGRNPGNQMLLFSPATDDPTSAIVTAP